MTVVIDGTTGIDTGTGSLIAANAATPTYLDLFEDTDNGSNYVRLIAPTSVAANRTITLPDGTGTVALTSDVIGVGQTWQDFTSSRALATTYTNSTGKPIQLTITLYPTGAGNQYGFVLINGTNIGLVGQVSGSAAATYYGSLISIVVPDGATYRLNTGLGTVLIYSWWELR